MAPREGAATYLTGVGPSRNRVQGSARLELRQLRFLGYTALDLHNDPKNPPNCGLREMRRFLSFALVGVLGFLVDASVLYLGLTLGLGLRLGRVISYLVAVTTTWLLNRIYTFKAPSGRKLWAEWAQFSVSQLGGAAANLGVYYILIRESPLVVRFPVLGVAAGSLSGLAINYAVARVFVFGGGIRYKAFGNQRQR
jgi:putative flippase GtrA